MERMLKAGYATFAWDKPGTGASTGEFSRKGLFDERTQIVLDAIKVLKNHPSIQPEMIGLWGISQAGYVMPLVLEQSQDVAFMIAVSCPGESGMKQGAYLLSSQALHEGMSEEEAKRFEETLEGVEGAQTYEEYVKAEANQVLNENVSGLDVTQEYTDLESRLRNLEKAELQLTAIMDQAWETEDVLSVYNRLVDVQEQIELIKGQMKYYEQSAALSAISISIQANEAVQPLKIGNWQPVGVAKRAIQALINTLEFIANLLIWIGLYILPVAVILFFPIRWIWRGTKRFLAKRKVKKEEETE